MPKHNQKIDTLGLVGRIQDGDFSEEEKDHLEALLLAPRHPSAKPSYEEFCAWFETAYEAKNGYVSTGDPMFYGQMQNAKAWAWAACQAFRQQSPASPATDVE